MDDPFANAREAGGGDESAPPAEEEEEEEEEEKKEEAAEDSVLAQCLLELEDIRMAEYALSRAEHMLLASTSIHNNGNDDDGRLVRLRHAGLGKKSFSTSFVGTVD